MSKSLEQQLREALIEAMCDERFRDISERDALEIGCEVAQEWQDRLFELNQEEE